ncbi:MAG: hypothetical protein QW290_05780 [Sulfolobales archaeon]
MGRLVLQRLWIDSGKPSMKERLAERHKAEVTQSLAKLPETLVDPTQQPIASDSRE